MVKLKDKADGAVADLRALEIAGATDLAPFDPDFTGILPVKQAQRVEQRTLAAARRTRGHRRPDRARPLLSGLHPVAQLEPTRRIPPLGFHFHYYYAVFHVFFIKIDETTLLTNLKKIMIIFYNNMIIKIEIMS